MIFSVFAMLLGITADIVHAHDFSSGETHTAISAVDSSDSQHNQADTDCDMACSSCCAHTHNLSTDSKFINAPIILSNKIMPEAKDLHAADFIYGLKRPPKA